MKLLHYFLRLSKNQQIFVVVLFFHLLPLFVMTVEHFFSSFRKKPSAIFVKTTFLEPLKEIPNKKTLSAAVPLPPKSKASPQTKKQASSQKPIPKKSSSFSPKKTSQKQEKILQDISKSFEALSSSSPPRKKVAIELPKKQIYTPSKEEPISFESFSLDYKELLITFLEDALSLPEYGEVKAQITVSSFGKITDCKILNSRSEKNETFLKNQLPQLTLPCLNSSQDESQTFIVTFHNRESL